MFNAIKDVEAVKSDLIQVQGNEKQTRQILNKRVPEIVEGILAGDNISLANQVIRSVVGHRKKEMFLFLSHHLPYEFNDDRTKFIKKSKDAKQVERKESAFREFKQSGQTVFGWLDVNAKVEKKEPDYLMRVERAVKQALKHKKSQREIFEAIFHADLEIDVDMLVEILSGVAAQRAEEDDEKAA